jgi:hypothetical protein
MWLSMYLLCVCFRQLFWTANADLIFGEVFCNLRLGGKECKKLLIV